MVQTHPHLQALRYEPNISSVAELTLQCTQSGLPITQILGAAVACVAGVTDEEVSAFQAYTSSLM